MDCSEGSYGQLMDHFACQETVDKLLVRTEFIFITHYHGDHQFGVLKILAERDRIVGLNTDETASKIYVITPAPII